MQIKIGIKALEYYLPEKVLTNDELAELYPSWTVKKNFDKTGIRQRHIAADGECVSDMAEKAGLKLFQYVDKPRIDFLLLATQSPDHLTPTTACILQ